MTTDTHLLTDLSLELGHHELRPIYKVADQDKRLPAGRGVVRDLLTITGRDNLRQAIMMSLQTPLGELAGLGHPEYGSRLHELIGRVNTDTTRNLARLYILETLKKEPRIEKINRVTVTQVQREHTLISVEIEVAPVGNVDTVTIGPFTISLV